MSRGQNSSVDRKDVRQQPKAFSDKKGGEFVMSNNSNNNNVIVPQAKAAMEKFKMEAANEVGVQLKNGYNGDLTSRQAGSIGGQMVKKMIKKYEQDLANGQ